VQLANALKAGDTSTINNAVADANSNGTHWTLNKHFYASPTFLQYSTEVGSSFKTMLMVSLLCCPAHKPIQLEGYRPIAQSRSLLNGNIRSVATATQAEELLPNCMAHSRHTEGQSCSMLEFVTKCIAGGSVTSNAMSNSQANSQAATATASAVAASIAKVQGGGDATAEGQALATAVAKVTPPPPNSLLPLPCLLRLFRSLNHSALEAACF